MTAQVYNNVSSTLFNSLDSASITVSVTDGTMFPSVSEGDWYPIHVVRSNNAFEIMHVMGSDENGLLTVERAQEGTDPLTFESGSTVQIRLTKETLANIDASDMTVESIGGGEKNRLSVWIDRMNEFADTSRETPLVISIPNEFDTLYDAVESIRYKALPVGSRVRIEIDEGSYSGGNWNLTTEISNSLSYAIDIVGLGAGASITTNLNFTDGVEGLTQYGPYKPFIYIKNVPMGDVRNLSIYSQAAESNAVVGVLLVGGNASANVSSRIEVKCLDGDVAGIALFNGASVDCRGSDLSGCGNRDEYDAGGVYENGSPSDDSAGSGLNLQGGCVAIADGLVANRCGIGINVARGSFCQCQGATADDCVHHGLLATRNSDAYADDSSFKNTLDDCLVAKWSSRIHADDCDISGSRDKTGAVIGETSHASLRRATVANSGTTGIALIRNSTCDAEGAVITNSGNDGLRVEQGSRATCLNITVTGSARYNLAALSGGFIEATAAVASGAASHCIYAEAGKIQCIGAVATGSETGSGVYATSGGEINARNVDASGGGATSEVQMYNGSIINFTGGTGNIQSSIVQNGVSQKGLFFF